MRSALRITLPHGYFAAGQRHRDAELRPLTGADEAFLAGDARALTPAERVTEIVARCLVGVPGGESPRRVGRALTVGDREALLLGLRAATFGDRLPCVVDCPDCGEPMDVELSVGDLLVPGYTDARERYEKTLGLGGDRMTVCFRLPTGEDQETAARAADADAGVRLLVHRCVEHMEADGDGAADFPDSLLGELSAAMADLDPQAETTLRLRCPACSAPFSALVDAATVLDAELCGDEERLCEEVHGIALQYHWSEAEILGLDLRRRRRYLDLIAGSST
jgi:hypothetical protein